MEEGDMDEGLNFTIARQLMLQSKGLVLNESFRAMKDHVQLVMYFYRYYQSLKTPPNMGTRWNCFYHIA